MFGLAPASSSILAMDSRLSPAANRKAVFPVSGSRKFGSHPFPSKCSTSRVLPFLTALNSASPSDGSGCNPWDASFAAPSIVRSG